ncbi:hypothetical protein HORM4_1130017 [Vibrio harveyi]|nr:hypothetical protein HORM4_1130017 [Vibrio harveyi]
MNNNYLPQIIYDKKNSQTSYEIYIDRDVSKEICMQCKIIRLQILNIDEG